MVFSEEEIKTRITKLVGWELKDGKIVKSFQFSSFTQAIEFVNKIAKIAEAHNHHPIITIIWKTVKISLMSFDVQGITERDFTLATEIESTVNNSFQK
jgi:4a-hydroxytetrahydrobiopterin dehydratase